MAMVEEQIKTERNASGQKRDTGWKLAITEGLAAVALGAYLLFRPAGSLVFLVQLLGIYWVISGITRTIAALAGRKTQGWPIRLAGGITTLALGAVVLVYPVYSAYVSAAVLSVAAAFFALIAGMTSIAWAINRPGILYGQGWIFMSGLLSILLGFSLLTAPFITLRHADTLIGGLALLSGAGQIIAGLSMRRGPGPQG